MTQKAAFEKALAGKKIFISGHTGFTGGWASLWLEAIGAEIAGYALKPDTEPSPFEATRLADGSQSTIGDICDFESGAS